MFDIAFTELVIMAVIALLIVGPERLPKLARQVGEWAGKLQRYVNDVKSDLNRQMELEELRNIKSEVTDAARELEKSVKSTVESTQKDFDSLSTSLTGDDDPVAQANEAAAQTDWDKVYEARRTRERLRERRVDREKSLGQKRPKRRF
ncbi:MAG: Sec-independent protein translocase protein TatB [Burkholderiaceae bacterium]